MTHTRRKNRPTKWVHIRLSPSLNQDFDREGLVPGLSILGKKYQVQHSSNYHFTTYWPPNFQSINYILGPKRTRSRSSKCLYHQFNTTTILLCLKKYCVLFSIYRSISSGDRPMLFLDTI